MCWWYSSSFHVQGHKASACDLVLAEFMESLGAVGEKVALSGWKGLTALSSKGFFMWFSCSIVAVEGFLVNVRVRIDHA